MKLLLIVTALFEAAAGIALILMPATAVSLLTGASLDPITGSLVARIAGAAIIALASAAWNTRNQERSVAAGIVQALLFYNYAAAALLVYAGVGMQLRSDLLWPAIVAHVGLGSWCLVNLWFTRKRLSRSDSISDTNIPESAAHENP